MNRNLKDILNLLSKLTFPRFINFIKIVCGYYLSRLLGRPVVLGMPFSVSVEPTTSCNLRCPECPSGLREFSRPTGMLDEKFFGRIIDQIYKRSVYIVFYFQGEPFLNKNFLKMVEAASEKKLYTATSTNAHYLDNETAKRTVGSGLDRLIISIDGTTQEVYEQYRIGGQLEKVIRGAENIIRWKKTLKSSTPYVVFQFLVVRPNEHQLADAILLGKSVGADEVVFKTAQVYDYENGNALIPSLENYSRYKKLADGKYILQNKLLNHCWKVWQSVVITWDGKIVPCCFDKDATHRVGDLHATSLQEIWKGKEFMNFRSSVLRSRKEIDICSNCSEGGKVWA